ncbi:hypothetical protein ELE36_11960 [Pseudolysobacter antarcticus]|uniref:Uncharacterized protein n=1 Tax=Pseudolysobacter antarcticus TaxID=2511995 RepID=A0A411HKG1_9GAMM|nr:hypothetical protein [Pseudolysobacter antarcticus]QBB71005.1 hypothetical protein ELE36_11960 [Pseudolysobacter antarcticus]
MSEMRFHWSISALPIDPDFVPSDARLDGALALLARMSLCTSLVPRAEPIAERHARPRFYGSEGFSYHAVCPVCGRKVERAHDEKGTAGRRWFAQVDEMAARGVDGGTPITMPGCDHEVALASVAFDHVTGAARCALVVELPVWIGKWFSDDTPDVEAALPALSEAFGAPVRLVRKLHILDPRDRRAIARFVSDDLAGRLDALRELDRERDDEEQDWDPMKLYYEDNEYALLAVLRDDPRCEVRSRALSMLVAGKCWSEAVRDAIAADLRLGGQAARVALHQSLHMPRELFRPLLPIVRTLAKDPSRFIRSNCAWALRFQTAQDLEDREVVRALALDFGPGGSHAEAIVAMENWIKASGAPIDEVDLHVLREVAVRCPQTRAGCLAAKLIA